MTDSAPPTRPRRPMSPQSAAPHCTRTRARAAGARPPGTARAAAARVRGQAELPGPRRHRVRQRPRRTYRRWPTRTPASRSTALTATALGVYGGTSAAAPIIAAVYAWPAAGTRTRPAPTPTRRQRPERRHLRQQRQLPCASAVHAARLGRPTDSARRTERKRSSELRSGRPSARRPPAAGRPGRRGVWAVGCT